MGRARLLVVLLVGSVVLAAGGAYVVVRHQQRLPTVTCRQLLESAQVDTLPAGVVHDLADPAFGVDVRALGLPPARAVDDARHAMQAEHAVQQIGPGPEDALVCDTGARGGLLLVRREDVPLEHCYGSAAQCAGEPTERRTCAELYSPAAPAGRQHDLGCPDLG